MTMMISVFSWMLWTFLVVSSDVLAQENVTRTPVLICFLTRNHPAPVRLYTHQIYQIDKHSTAFPGLEFQWKLLYNNQNSDSTSLLRTIVANGTDCQAYFGPVSSSLALGTGPLIDAPQMDSASGSTELSDDVHFPFYNRVNAVQAGIKLMAKTILYFDWEVVNVLCTDESLGRQISQILDETFDNSTTRIAIQHCVSENPTRMEVTAALQQVQKESRILVLAVNPVVDAWKGPDGILQQIHEMGLGNSHVLFLPTGQQCHEIAGLPHALCVDGLLDEEAFQMVLDDYQANVDLDRYGQAFLEAGVDPDNLSFDPWNHLLTHLAYDAAHFFLQSYAAEYSRGSNFDPNNYTAMLQAIRSHSMNGYTGLIELDEIGDRKTESLYNVYSKGNSSNERTIILNNRNQTINRVGSEPIVWFDGSTDIPLAAIEEDFVYESGTNTMAIAIMVPILAFMVLVVAGLLIRMKHRLRALGYAPTKGHMALAFTDIESSTKLWRRDSRLNIILH